MSFSSKVKKELAGHISNATHCRIAEIAAIISMCGSVLIDVDEKYSIRVRTETDSTAEKFKTLVWKTFHIDAKIVVKKNAYSKNAETYTITIKDHNQAMKVLEATKLIDDQGQIGENLSVTNNVVIMKDCCKRAFIRGAFMAAGSISDPNSSYHFEIKCNNEKKAEQLIKLLNKFNIEAKTVARKGHFVVYIKEGEGIVDVLNVMEATVALMEMENVRILKGMSNYYNRQVNCETANIKKTVTTACRQIDDINYIIENEGLEYLPDKLQDIATLRVENPDASLQELGQMLEPQLGKSGVNHRLRKICQIAEEIRVIMITKDVTIDIKQATDASPVAKCVQLASQFKSKIYIENGATKVNAKSIMGMMALGILSGEEVKVSAEGDDEQNAIDTMVNYLTAN